MAAQINSSERVSPNGNTKLILEWEHDSPIDRTIEIVVPPKHRVEITKLPDTVNPAGDPVNTYQYEYIGQELDYPPIYKEKVAIGAPPREVIVYQKADAGGSSQARAIAF